MNLYNQIKMFIYNNFKKIIIITSVILIGVITTFILISKNKFKENIVTIENKNSLKGDLKQEEKIIKEKEYYYIDIKGYVNNPGVYSLEKGKRVVDAINIAGGLKKDANTSLLNLSLEIYDQMVIIVYSNSEIKDFVELQTKKQQEEKICEKNIINNACTSNTSTKNDNESKSNQNNQTSDNNKQSEAKEEKLMININTASKEELMKLKNVGSQKADAIIEYRNTNGLFKSIEDLKNVSGIGDKLFESIKENITI